MTSKTVAQDIEAQAQALDERIEPGCCVAAASQAGAEAKLVLLAEVAQFHTIDPHALCRVLRHDLFLRSSVLLHTIALLPAGGVLRTPNGKLRRAASLERGGAMPLFVSSIDPSTATSEAADDALA
ncbi:hypothetical protein [Verminephrobacter eiseniae]|uniref:hypothetical protein n=1 Tax=Verminephrobacter eiseniae TaxID=364317 RepID=UPI0022382FA1|nr:hypothetical protein [Verminephrobacter eiseniae]